jgi:hypothetical protein
MAKLVDIDGKRIAILIPGQQVMARDGLHVRMTLVEAMALCAELRPAIQELARQTGVTLPEDGWPFFA